MKYTIQQTEAMRLIKNFIDSQTSQIFILRGYAGTGKTTLISSIVDVLLDKNLGIQIMAPTGKVTKVLRSKLSRKEVTPTTIHKGIYQFKELVIEEKEDMFEYIYPLRDNESTDYCIIDEASMISSIHSNQELFKFGSGFLLQDLLEYARIKSGGKIIFVGDPMQLPPVTDNESCALSDDYFQKLGFSVLSYQLTEIVRQDKTSCVLTNAEKLRSLISVAKENRNELTFDKKDDEFMDVSKYDVCKCYCADHTESAIICFTNQQAAEYNKAIREIKFPSHPHVCIGDKLMVVSNNYYKGHEFYNGDIITVTNVTSHTITQAAPVWIEKGGAKTRENIHLDFRKIQFKDESGNTLEEYIIETLLENSLPGLTVNQIKALYINLMMRLGSINEQLKAQGKQKQTPGDAVRDDEFYNALQVKYGYASTCHKAQGSEWEHVYVDFTKRTGLDDNSLRWKYAAITRASKTLFCIGLPDINPIMSLTISPITKCSKFSEQAISLGIIPTCPFYGDGDSAVLRAKYWSIERNLRGSDYSILNITHLPFRERYEVKAPQGIIHLDCIYNKAGIFTAYTCSESDDVLLNLFKNEDNITYKIDYHSAHDSLNVLFQRMVSLCDELGITLTNVCEANYKASYYMKASGIYASLTFNFNSKGFINYATPLSDMGAADVKLQQLVDLLK